MSERMIELRRQGLGLPPATTNTNINPSNNKPTANGKTANTVSAAAAAAAAAATAWNGNTHGHNHNLFSNGSTIAAAGGTTALRSNVASTLGGVQPANGVLSSSGTGGAGGNHRTIHGGMGAGGINGGAATAANLLMGEDERMRRFLHLLSTRSHNHPDTAGYGDGMGVVPVASVGKSTTNNNNNTNNNNIQSSSSHKPPQRTDPTTPLSLSRRILHRQGSGYFDSTVPAIISGAADRFLATLLHQSITCQNRRLNGEKLLRNEERERRRVGRRRMAEAKGRRRRVEEREKALGRKVAELGRSGGGGKRKGGGGNNGKSRGGGGGNQGNAATGGNGGVDLKLDGDVTSETDSIHEEENYYETYYGEKNDVTDDVGLNQAAAADAGSDGDASYDEDEFEEHVDCDLNEVLQLRDLVQPLEAWGINLTGKVGLNADTSTEAGVDAALLDVANNNNNMVGDELEGDNGTAGGGGETDNGGDDEGDDDDDDIAPAAASGSGNVSNKRQAHWDATSSNARKKRATSPKQTPQTPAATGDQQQQQQGAGIGTSNSPSTINKSTSLPPSSNNGKT